MQTLQFRTTSVDIHVRPTLQDKHEMSIFRGWHVQVSMELGPDVSLLERYQRVVCTGYNGVPLEGAHVTRRVHVAFTHTSVGSRVRTKNRTVKQRS